MFVRVFSVFVLSCVGMYRYCYVSKIFTLSEINPELEHAKGLTRTAGEQHYENRVPG